MAMVWVPVSQIILQKSATVPGRGPWVAMNSLGQRSASLVARSCRSFGSSWGILDVLQERLLVDGPDGEWHLTAELQGALDFSTICDSDQLIQFTLGLYDLCLSG
ncbi:hypothetical protein EYF80_009662 [Liparis tanakae]|uniref:Uncharacterized protein n=1 Tax=Liparis tanakae TaxID=230148 RepID=A0A4Z2IS40_9TELE|nr:hypothetical protein EYF80_009662 [Liparis tanakae]